LQLDTHATPDVWRHGKGFSIAFGLAMITFACFVPWHPSLLPGLYMNSGM
jgi:hypothetical protein